MVFPLSSVRGTLILYNIASRPRDFSCVALPCDVAILPRRLDEAEALNFSHLIKYVSMEDEEDAQGFLELRQLARLLLCPKHEDERCDEIARAWQEERPDNDTGNDFLSSRFELKRNPVDWKCLTCDTACAIDRGRAWSIVYALSMRDAGGTCLETEKEGKFIRELFALLHCDKHRTLENITPFLGNWYNILTKLMKHPNFEDSSCKEITPKKTEANEDHTTSYNESRANPIGGALSTGFGCPSGFETTSTGFTAPSNNVGGLKPPHGGLFGSQPYSDGLGTTSTGFTAPSNNIGGPKPPHGGLFGSQPYSDGLGTISTGFAEPSNNVEGPKSTSGGLFGSQGGPGGSASSKGTFSALQSTFGDPKPSKGGLFGSLAGSGGFASASTFGDSKPSNGGFFGSLAGSGGFASASTFGDPKSSKGGLFGSLAGSGGSESSKEGLPAFKSGFGGFGSNSGGFGSGFGSYGSSNLPLTSRLVSDERPAPPIASQSGSLPPDPRQHSSQKVPVSSAEQTETASPGLKGPVVSTGDDHGRHSPDSRRTSSPLPKPPPLNGAQCGGSPVSTSLLGPSPSVAQALDNPGSHASSDIYVSGQQPHDNRSPQLRETHSYPNLHGESRSRNLEPERAVPTNTSPSSASVRAQEDAIFEKANRNEEPGQIDMKLLRYIRSKKADISKKLVSSLGDVYVFQNPEWPDHVKIGQTQKDPDDRMAAIKRKCKIKCLEQVVDTERKDFRNYALVEKLCHKELKNFKKTLLCTSCMTPKAEQQNHQEWFQVDPEVAVRTVQKWRKWMSLSPYDEDGNLVPWWQQKPSNGLVGEQLPDVEKETIDDHDSRHRRWSRWLERPTTWQRINFEIWRFFCDVRPERKSLWDTAEKNAGPLMIYLIVVWFVCKPKEWILLVLFLLLVLRDWA